MTRDVDAMVAAAEENSAPLTVGDLTEAQLTYWRNIAERNGVSVEQALAAASAPKPSDAEAEAKAIAKDVRR